MTGHVAGAARRPSNGGSSPAGGLRGEALEDVARVGPRIEAMDVAAGQDFRLLEFEIGSARRMTAAIHARAKRDTSLKSLVYEI